MYAGSSEYDIDKEYLPSKNGIRFQDCEKPEEELIANFIRVTRADTEQAKAHYKVVKDIRYGGVNDRQLVDIYYKDKEQGTPLFVFIHGGYWQLLSKNEGGSFVKPFAELGYRVVVADYNLCPNVTLEQLTQQMSSFFKWLLEYAESTNTSEIHLSGHSAGAHLLAYLLSPEFLSYPAAQRIKSLFFISGVYDLRELWCLESVNPKDILCLTPETAAQMSPLLFDYSKELIDFINKQQVKLQVVVAEHDSTTFKAQTLAYADKLLAAGFKYVQKKVFDGYDHCDIIEEGSNPKSCITSYITAITECTCRF